MIYSEIEEIYEISKDLNKKFVFAHASDLVKVAVSVQRNMIEMRRNVILEKAFAVSDNMPSALEALAIQFGMTSNGKGCTLIDVLCEISDNLKKE